jgi:zinc transporter ZupT
MLKLPELSQKNKDRLTSLKGRLREEFISAQTGFLGGLVLPLIFTDYLLVNLAAGLFVGNITNRLNLTPRLTGLVLGLATGFGVNVYQSLDRHGILDHIERQIEESKEPEGVMVQYDGSNQSLPSLTMPKSKII